MSDLNTRLENIARTPVLLVATDYDGTLAPIVSDPASATPIRESMVALRTLASMPQTHVALISGRALRDLSRLTGEPEDVHLVGSHGSEFDPGFADTLSEKTLRLRERIAEQLEEIAEKHTGARLEHKPASVAFHYRDMPEDDADDVVERVLRGPGAWEGVYTKRGKRVVELSVLSNNKGTALESIRHRLGATSAIFFGDDATDEDAFATLKGPDIGVKVGPGESIAPYRIEDATEVARTLARLSELRSGWIAGSDAVPIERHALLSDQRTVAVLSPNARITWMCAPRVDSPPIFAELLGNPADGHFSICPIGEDCGTPTQEYLDDSLVLRTSWKSLTLTDYLDCSEGRVYQRAGRVEMARVLEGRGRVRIEFAPRIDFGRVVTRIHQRDDGLEVEGSLDPIVLRCPGVEWTLEEEGEHQTARAEVDLNNGPMHFTLRYGTANLNANVVKESDRREQTLEYWNRWVARLRLPDQYTDVVRRSAVILKSLCHGPTGAIVAAGTTSLPEHIGGVRNWDYRYCWPRDAAYAARALVLLGSNSEALGFLDWLLNVVDSCESPDRLAPIYTVSGSHLGAEGEISGVAGYAGSRPVRVGNAAASQVQLDVFGPIVDLIATLVEAGAPLSAQHWRLTEAMVDAVKARWREADHGIWEVRRPRQHHVHSKAMCWLTVDRAMCIAETLLSRERHDLRELRDEIANDIFQNCWCDERKTFTSTYSSDELDAATLLIGLIGLTEPTDDRFVSTVEAIERHLKRGDTVYRYLYDDGLPGVEGGFHLCTTWLIESLAAIGREDDARSLLDSLIGCIGPTGLLSEEIDPDTGRALGNVPQAYSHAGLITAALRLAGHEMAFGRRE